VNTGGSINGIIDALEKIIAPLQLDVKVVPDRLSPRFIVHIMAAGWRNRLPWGVASVLAIVAAALAIFFFCVLQSLPKPCASLPTWAQTQASIAATAFPRRSHRDALTG
jgi:hypothetical protein